MHPLDPLSADEITAVAATLRREQQLTDRWRFASIELREPSKETVKAFTPGDPIAREAVVIGWDRDDGAVYKARVTLDPPAVTSWERQTEGQPNMTVDEFNECDAALRKDPRVIEALAQRGITDLDRVLIDTWAYGAHLVPEQHRGGRIGWADVWYRKSPGASPYANPVTGLHFVVDLNRMELLEVEDTHRVDEPDTMGEYVPDLVPGPRAADRHQAAAHPSARRPVVHARRQRAELAEVVAARRLQPPRRPGDPHRRLRRSAPSRTASRSRRWSSPIATRRPTTTAARRSTSASGDSGS